MYYKTILSAFFLFITIVSCNNEKKPEAKKEEKKGALDDKTIDSLLKAELAHQEMAKSGNKNPQIEIINDPQQARDLRAELISRRRQMEHLEKQKAKLEPAKTTPEQQPVNKVFKPYDKSFDTIVKSMLELKLLTMKPDKAIISEVVEETGGSHRSFAFALLERDGVYLFFDAEPGIVPVDYEKLMLEFASKSKDVLKDMQVVMNAEESMDSKTFTYTVKVVSNNKIFILKPMDMGDWYDIMAVNGLLEAVLADLGSEKRFVSIETGDQTVQYVFGKPNLINRLVAIYKLL